MRRRTVKRSLTVRGRARQVERRHWDPDPMFPELEAVCAGCGTRLRWVSGQPRPVRCSPCVFVEPQTFARFYPHPDSHREQSRIDQFDAGVEFWRRHQPMAPGMGIFMGSLARRIDSGTTSGRRPYELFRECCEHYTVDTMDRRLAAAAFVDQFGPDFEFLFVCWCAAQRATS